MLVTIRKSSLQDVHSIAPLFDLYRMFYQQPSDIAGAVAFITARLEQQEGVIFLAEDTATQQLLGFVQLYPIFSSVGMKRAWLLNDFYVAETARGKGVASLLLTAAKEFGIETNSRWLLLQTATDNFTAQSVYERNGWQRLTDLFYELPLDK